MAIRKNEDFPVRKITRPVRFEGVISKTNGTPTTRGTSTLQQNLLTIYRPQFSPSMTRKCFTKARAALFLCLLLFAICLPVGNAGAQDLITTMTEQLAKLELYLKETKDGYSIVQKGLTTIGDIKKGDFDLHSLFFTSLKDVNPAIKNWGKVADIITMQVQLLAGSKTSLRQVTASGNFSPADLKYLAAVFSNLINLTGKDINVLSGLVSDGNWQMTDDDRMSRIDHLFNEVSEKYNFLRSFSSQVMAESSLRTHQKATIQKLRQLILP
jgi:hypothetical protein